MVGPPQKPIQPQTLGSAFVTLPGASEVLVEVMFGGSPHWLVDRDPYNGLS